MAHYVPDDGQGFGMVQPRAYTRAEKLRNWWHYHAGWVIFGAILIFGTGYFVHDMFFRPKPDYQIAFVTTRELPAAVRANLQAQFEAMGEDVNGDGRVLVELLVYPLGFDMRSQTNVEATSSAVTRLTVDLTTGRVYTVFLDDPAGFQARIGALGYLDGRVPDAEDATHGAADWEQMVYSWDSCPVLAGLDLGTYLPFTAPAGGEVDGQTAMEGVYVARRAMRSAAQQEAFAADEALWEKMTAHAVPAA